MISKSVKEEKEDRVKVNCKNWHKKWIEIYSPKRERDFLKNIQRISIPFFHSLFYFFFCLQNRIAYWEGSVRKVLEVTRGQRSLTCKSSSFRNRRHWEQTGRSDSLLVLDLCLWNPFFSCTADVFLFISKRNRPQSLGNCPSSFCITWSSSMKILTWSASV